MVGPDDFHVDNKLDKLRDNWGLPWLSVDITFTAEQNMIPELMQIQLIFPLEKRHLPINKVKRYFHSLRPKASHIKYNDIEVTKECEDLTLTFEVENSYIAYSLDDFSDECLPFTVEGKWHKQLTAVEEKSEREDREISEDLEHITETEKEDIIMDNDVLVEELEEEMEMNHMTDTQLAKMKDLAEKARKRREQLKNKK